MTTTEEPKTKTTTTTVSPPPVVVPLMNRMTTDLLECSALGSFMFLINELRLMSKKQQEDSSSDSDSNSKEEKEKGKANTVIFDPLYKFPLLPSSIEKIVIEKATELIEKQGQRRHDAHLQMFEFFRNYNKNLAINVEGGVGGNSNNSSEEGVHILDYHDEHESEGQIVYSIVIDHISKRIIVVFRGSVTKGDWEANFDANHRKIENPLYDSEEDNTSTKDNKQKQPQFMVVHRGFYDYMYKPFTEEEEENNGQKTKTTTTTVIDSIVSNVVLQLQQYPNYSIFTTGVSLGGALTIVFSFFVAACYKEELPGVITCYSFASPKVGTVSFRKAYQSLEKSGRLRLLRLANINDPVVLLPRDPCQCIPYLDGLLCAFCLLSNQERIYRHVGLGMLLFPIVTDDDDDIDYNKPPQFKHTKFESSHNCCRVWCSDIGKQWGRYFICLAHIICCCKTAKIPYRQNHGYPEYWYRSQTAALNEKSNLQNITLDDLYNEFMSGDRTRVATRFM